MDGIRAYVTDRRWAADWTGNTHISVPTQQDPVAWRAAITYRMRGTAAATTMWYGLAWNPTFWAGACVFGILMGAASGYSFLYNVRFYIIASILAYVMADLLPLKYFSSDEGGVTVPLWAAYRNSVRMFLPMLLAGLSVGKLAIGYTLVALAAVAVVEAGKHGLFHANGGYLLADWTMMTDMLERRLALVGISLPPNMGIIEVFLGNNPVTMDVDTDPKAFEFVRVTKTERL